MEIPHKFRWILKNLYGLPASISVITGLWKTGKTDFSLHLSEILRELGIIDIVASNIETEGGNITYVDSLSRLKYWFFNTRGRKLFLYDETIESTPRRRAMSRINVEWIKTIPQLSKARGHIIALTQEESLTESVFFMPTFNRGLWRKLSKKIVVFSSRFLRIENYRLNKIPRTNIGFDPYLVATFQIEDRSILTDTLPIYLKAIDIYGRGLSFERGAKELGLKQANEFRRLLQKGCRIILTSLREPSEGKKIIERSKALELEDGELPNMRLIGKANKEPAIIKGREAPNENND